ncbi:sporulation protein YqfD [Paenibacillus sp. GCM10023252]|uniref:sporulation protein YqfD n=1 Tax=Paenibacillus sp. GCM10023252 TaxID=3252649 RepID=UPI00360A9548
MTWMQWLRGVVTVRIRGEHPEALVNGALKGGLQLWSIRWTSPDHLQFEVSVSDFFKLRAYLRETGCRMHVLRRQGMPFWLAKAEKRKFFAVGLVIFLTGIYLLSSLVWDVEVKGNTRIPEEHILQVAKQEGLYPFQWSFRLTDADVLSKRLVSRLPDASWIGVEKKGTRVIIQVVETTLPQPQTLYSPRHLVASEDAVVTQILAEAGRPVVKKNHRVKRGQILISGTIGADANTRTVVAKGTVRGLVWYEYQIASPLTQKVKVYTGESITKWYAVIGSRAVQVSGYGKEPYAQAETIQELKQGKWRSWTLPLGKMKETILEVRTDVRTLSKEEARSTGILQAKANIMVKAGEDAVIRDEKILHEKSDNGKVYMKVLFEVEQSIVHEMPLVQMQGE